MVEENFFFLYRALVLQEGTDFLDPGWGPCFHFALDPANYIADPGYGLFLGAQLGQFPGSEEDFVLLISFLTLWQLV